MANTFKNIKKKLRRKRLLAEKRHLEKAQAGAGGNEAARRKIKAALRYLWSWQAFFFWKKELTETIKYR